MSTPAFTARTNLTDIERLMLSTCEYAVATLTTRAQVKKQGNAPLAFGLLKQACEQLAATRDALEKAGHPMPKRQAFSDALAKVAPSHAQTLSLYLMVWELRKFPGQVADELKETA